MGLDLVPLGRPRLGFEQEHNRLFSELLEPVDARAERVKVLLFPVKNAISKIFGFTPPVSENPDQKRIRFEEISIPPLETLGAWRIGVDPEVEEWLRAHPERLPAGADVSAWTGERKGEYFTLSLPTSDGMPRYSNGGLYEGADATSFRGQFLAFDEVAAILDKATIDAAWDSKTAAVAETYGQSLLGAASAFAASQDVALDNAFAERSVSDGDPLFGLSVVWAAARWHIFWGSRGHPVWANF